MSIKLGDDKSWIVELGLATLAVAVLWGSLQSSVAAVKDDVKDIKTWKDSAVKDMGEMKGMLHALLEAQGLDYDSSAPIAPRRVHRAR